MDWTFDLMSGIAGGLVVFVIQGLWLSLSHTLETRKLRKTIISLEKQTIEVEKKFLNATQQHMQQLPQPQVLPSVPCVVKSKVFSLPRKSALPK